MSITLASSMEAHARVTDDHEPTFELLGNSESSLEPVLLSRPTERIFGAVILVVLALLPICFGSVHRQVFLSMAIPIFSLSAYLSWRSLRFDGFKVSYLLPTRLAQRTLGLLVLLTFYLVLQNLTLKLFSSPHPVLGSVKAGANWQAFATLLQPYLTFLAVFVLASFGFKEARRLGFSSSALISLVGLIVAMIALSHWFYDNGKLFWSFQPDYQYISQRARWPFVNPNHLAAFLLVPFFVTLSRTESSLQLSFNYLKEAVLSKGIDVLEDSSFQHKIVSLALSALSLFAIGTAILASLSRAAWLSLGSGILIYVFLSKLPSFKHSRLKQPSENNTEKLSGKIIPTTDRKEALSSNSFSSTHSARSGIRKRRRKQTSLKERELARLKFVRFLEYVPRSFLPIGLCFAIFALIIFFNQLGSELVEQRVQLALLHSMHDIRTEFYKISFSMYLDSPFLGIGLGQWSDHFSSRMPESMSGINTSYLHSDPLQFIIEAGLFGALILISLYLLYSRSVILTLKQGVLDSRDLSLVLSLYTGMSALLLASCLDFPFRIPAISLYFAAYMALLSSKIKDSRDTST